MLILVLLPRLCQIMQIAVVAAAVYASIARASRTRENILSPLSAVLAWGSKITLQYAKK
jgi:hypothetical protein